MLTFGLAYPFQLASLERYKMRNTFYGDLGGRFEASAFVLLLRGLPMWLLVFAPLALAVSGFVGSVDWKALVDALAQGGDDVMGKIEGGNPGLGGTIVFAMLMGGVEYRLCRPALSGISGDRCCDGGPRDCALATSKCARACAYAMSTAPMRASSAMRCLFSIVMGIVAGMIAVTLAGAAGQCRET